MTQNNHKKRIKATSLISHNIMVHNRRTSVRLEKEMWLGLKEIARRERCTIHDLCTDISENKRDNTTLTSAIRIAVMMYYYHLSTQGNSNLIGSGKNVMGLIIRRNENTPYYGLRHFKTVSNDRLH